MVKKTRYYYQDGKSVTVDLDGPSKGIVNSFTDMKKGFVYTVNHKKKIVEKMDLKTMAKSQKTILKSIRRSATGKFKKVKGRKCKLFKTKIFMVTMTSCEVPYQKLRFPKKYYNEMQRIAAKIGFSSGLFFQKDYMSIETIMPGIMGAKAQVTRFVVFKEKSLSNSMFKLPKGYKVIKSKVGKNGMPDNVSPEQMEKAISFGN